VEVMTSGQKDATLGVGAQARQRLIVVQERYEPSRMR